MRATRRPSSIALELMAIAVLALVAVGCGTSGRTLRDPAPGATAPPRKGASTTAPAALQTTPAVGLSISSTGWSPGEEIPRGYTCDGQSASPPLTISGAPEGTVELVLVVSDQDAGGFLHWVVAGIPPGTPIFPQGEVPAGAIEAPNGSGSVAWFAPCPPAGTTHTYDFTVYALTAASGLSASSTPVQLDATLTTATSTAAMTGTYTRA
jgi:Raf kinase inhibitor-like YbhB/YbcL family protein